MNNLKAWERAKLLIGHIWNKLPNSTQVIDGYFYSPYCIRLFSYAPIDRCDKRMIRAGVSFLSGQEPSPITFYSLFVVEEEQRYELFPYDIRQSSQSKFSLTCPQRHYYWYGNKLQSLRLVFGYGVEVLYDYRANEYEGVRITGKVPRHCPLSLRGQQELYGTPIPWRINADEMADRILELSEFEHFAAAVMAL